LDFFLLSFLSFLLQDFFFFFFFRLETIIYGHAHVQAHYYHYFTRTTYYPQLESTHTIVLLRIPVAYNLLHITSTTVHVSFCTHKLCRMPFALFVSASYYLDASHNWPGLEETQLHPILLPRFP
jgi:hypothetical protein